MDGVEATRRIARAGLDTKVLVLTTFDLDEYVFAALKAGASGFLLKDARPADLLNAIRNVAAGEAVMAPSRDPPVARPRGADRCPPRRAVDTRLDVLTEREREVLIEIAAGATNSEIADHALHGRGHGEDPHRTAAGQAALPRPRRPGAAGLRDGPRAPLKP